MHSPDAQKTTVLIVDSDPASRESLRDSLACAQLRLIEAGSLEEALSLAARRAPDLVLSELVLDDASGFALCRRIRESPGLDDVPIVLVSRWCHEADRILAFECGADDFVARPFFARELASRTRALLRRRTPAWTTKGDAATRPVPAGRGVLRLDTDRREVTVAGRCIVLTPREFSLLIAMVRRRGRVITRAELIAEAWGDGAAPGLRSVDAHVKSLRRKLGGARDAVETIRGLGYRLSARSFGAEEVSAEESSPTA